MNLEGPNLDNVDKIETPENISSIEEGPQEEPWSFDTTEYERLNNDIATQIEQAKFFVTDTKSKITETRKELGLDDSVPETEEIPSVVLMEQNLDNLEKEKIKCQANYPGDWTSLLQERMLDQITKEKFIKTRQESIPQMKDGEPGLLEKPKTFGSHYQTQIDNYDENILKVFNSTQYIPSQEVGKNPNHLGSGNIGETGAVFTDARTSENIPLTIRQKNIVESHEKGHGLRDFYAPDDTQEINSVLDTEVLKALIEKNNLENPDNKERATYLKDAEIIERMSQLKNYFGFRAGDIFTKEHLLYARENYIKDTGLDNSMSNFFQAITPEKEERFLKVINKYPI